MHYYFFISSVSCEVFCKLHQGFTNTFSLEVINNSHLPEPDCFFTFFNQHAASQDLFVLISSNMQIIFFIL